jgi:signal transduction histidine kinase
MADRLGAVGGALEIRSTPGAGTEVRGRVPVGSAQAVSSPARVG